METHDFCSPTTTGNRHNVSCRQHPSLICVFSLAPAAQITRCLGSIRWWMISDRKSRGSWSQSPENVFPANVHVKLLVRGIHTPKLVLIFLYNKYFDICWQPACFPVQVTLDFRLNEFSVDLLWSLQGYQNQTSAISHKHKHRLFSFQWCYKKEVWKHVRRLRCSVTVALRAK